MRLHYSGRAAAEAEKAAEWDEQQRGWLSMQLGVKKWNGGNELLVLNKQSEYKRKNPKFAKHGLHFEASQPLDTHK